MELNPYTFSNLKNNVFKKNESVVSRKIAGETFLVPVKGNLADMQMIFTLNPVAEFIWQELDKKNLRDICDDVVSTFEVEKEQAEADISEFVTELLEAELLVRT
jgi:hypothetical protein